MIKHDYPWQPANVNNEWQMTKIVGQEIAVRKMKWWEKIRYFYLFVSFN